jgi:hypothetical protein
MNHPPHSRTLSHAFWLRLRWLRLGRFLRQGAEVADGRGAVVPTFFRAPTVEVAAEPLHNDLQLEHVFG